MTDTTVLTSIWMILVIELVLQAGIVINAYRLTKLTGSFRAWTMIILAFTLTAASSIFGVVLLLINPSEVTTLLQSFDLPTLLLSYSITISSLLLLFFGIFDLLRRFKHAANKP